MPRKPPPKRLLTLFGLLAFGIGSVTVFADIVPEQPWHPVAAAYLRSTFYLNLGPQVDWGLVEQEYTASILEEGYSFASVLEALEPVEETFGSTLIVPIEQAIAAQDPSTLFDASTRAVSQTVRYYVSRAEEKLSRPGAALQDVLAAQQIYRAFGQNFISEADPEAFGLLGRAWLDMADSAGSAGVVGLGGAAADPGQFAAAKAVIEPYLITNFEDGGFVVDTPLGQRFAPIPVTAENTVVPVWTPPGTDLNDQVPLPLLRLNFEARGFDETDIPLVAFGDMVFDSPEVFGEPARSIGLTCATCHNRSDINRSFFIPGVSHQPGAVDVDGAFFNPYFNDQRSDSLDIPSLRGLRYTAPYGRDGRFGSLRDFLRTVHVQEFGGPEPTGFMLDALVAYVLEFDFLPNSYLNPDGTLSERASESAHRGGVIFKTPYEGMMGGMSCAACHTPGSHFTDGEQWDIGSVSYESEPHSYGNYLETPTLLNSAYTFPYFHDGSLATLEDVAEWKNSRFDMNLDDKQLADLSEYLRTVGSADEPYEVFDDENTPFLLAWSELTTFATTLGSMLIPRQDAFHARLLIDTVAADLRADSSGLQDYGDAGMVFEVADKLDEIKAAIERDDWLLAEALYEEYAVLVEEYGPELR